MESECVARGFDSCTPSSWPAVIIITFILAVIVAISMYYEGILNKFINLKNHKIRRKREKK